MKMAAAKIRHLINVLNTACRTRTGNRVLNESISSRRTLSGYILRLKSLRRFSPFYNGLSGGVLCAS